MEGGVAAQRQPRVVEAIIAADASTTRMSRAARRPRSRRSIASARRIERVLHQLHARPPEAGRSTTSPAWRSDRPARPAHRTLVRSRRAPHPPVLAWLLNKGPWEGPLNPREERRRAKPVVRSRDQTVPGGVPLDPREERRRANPVVAHAIKRFLGGSFRSPAKSAAWRSPSSLTAIKRFLGGSFRSPAKSAAWRSPSSLTRSNGSWEGPLDPLRRAPPGEARRRSRDQMAGEGSPAHAIKQRTLGASDAGRLCRA